MQGTRGGTGHGHRAVPFAEAVVAAQEKDADTTRVELREQEAHARCIVLRGVLLVVTGRRDDRLRDAVFFGHVKEPAGERVASSSPTL